MQKKHWISRKAHGFKKRHNCLTNAQVHAGKKYILNIDVKDFFTSITSIAYRNYATRERNLMETKYKEEDQGFPNLFFYAATPVFHSGSLPQGAPTSPFISNIYMRRFDTQIEKLLRQYISDDILYTRYVDDLTFSSNSRAVERVIPIVRGKLKALRLEINDAKTKFMTPSQRQEITGININSGRPTIGKAYRRKVRAIVHRAEQGWVITSAQKERLLGMISHIALCHPEEAAKYREALLPIATTPDSTRKFGGVDRIKLPVRKGRGKKKQTNGKVGVTGASRTVKRRITINKKGKIHDNDK
jgi:RNA-directed DNA polymerase